jgi:hypothetical protein
VSEKIEAKAGPDGEVQCVFDGDALELLGYTASVMHFPISQVNLKRKKKPEKDGGQTIYVVVPTWSSRIELYFQPSELPNMEKLVDGLFAAGAKKI